MKKLSDMTLEELWELFPIFLTEHDRRWAQWYDEEINILGDVLPDVKFYHIGSTAVSGICAKPIIDILAEVNDRTRLYRVADILRDYGYIIMASSEGRISLNKGYTEKGFDERVFHLHIRLSGDTDEIYFRDYLNTHPATAKEYETLKLTLWKKFEHDRDAYTDAKTEFVKKYTALGKNEV